MLPPRAPAFVTSNGPCLTSILSTVSILICERDGSFLLPQAPSRSPSSTSTLKSDFPNPLKEISFPYPLLRIIVASIISFERISARSTTLWVLSVLAFIFFPSASFSGAVTTIVSRVIVPAQVNADPARTKEKVQISTNNNNLVVYENFIILYPPYLFHI